MILILYNSNCNKYVAIIFSINQTHICPDFLCSCFTLEANEVIHFNSYGILYVLLIRPGYTSYFHSKKDMPEFSQGISFCSVFYIIPDTGFFPQWILSLHFGLKARIRSAAEQ